MEVQVSEESTVPKSGDGIETSGFIEMDPFHLRLSEAVVRPSNEQFPPLPPPQDIDLGSLFSSTNGVGRIDTSKHGHVIRFAGKISDLANDMSSDTFFVQSGRHGVSVDVSGLAEPHTMPGPGTEVEITGLCISEFKDDFAHRSIPRFRRYVILPRTASDLLILAAPPWWTPARLLLVIAILAVALLIVLGWNRTLRILSERRGRQLYREQLGHVLAEKKTEEERGAQAGEDGVERKRERQRDRQRSLKNERSEKHETNSRTAASQREDHGLAKKLPHDNPAARSQRPAEPDLRLALLDRNVQNIGYPESPDQQGEKPDDPA